MSDTTYQGWATRATWAVHLHLTTDQGLCDAAQTVIHEAAVSWTAPHDTDWWYGDDEHHQRSARTHAAAETLREWVQDAIRYAANLTHADSDPWLLLLGDLLPWGEVEWVEIVDALDALADED